MLESSRWDICERYGNMAVSEDGYWGEMTTIALQTYFGQKASGQIWHQWQPNVSQHGALTGGWNCDSTLQGDVLVRALQTMLGVAVDGIFGSGTASALQARMGTPVDGILGAGSPCVREMQRRLNNGTF